MSTKKSKTLLLTSYFSIKEHPNSPQDSHVVGRNNDGKVFNNSFDYIAPWYKSITDLKLNGIIVHDNLSESFCQKHTNDFVTFIKVDQSDWSNLDYRWMCYEKIVEKNIDYDNVFMTDCSDVCVVKDPDELIKNYREFDFFACRDSINLCDFPYMNFHENFNLEDKVWFMLNQNNLELINMGVIGGKLDRVMKFLNIYNNFRLSIGAKDFGQADMFCGQYVFRKLLSEYKTMIGYPACSEFKKYQNDRKERLLYP